MKLFVWDFHGVMEKGNEKALMEIGNFVLEQFGYEERFAEEICHQLNGKKLTDYFVHLLPEEPAANHQQLYVAFMAKAYAEPEIIAKHLEPNDYLHQVLAGISSKHQQILISNTPPLAIPIFINAIQINPFFSNHNAFGADQPGRDKLAILQDYLQGKEVQDLIVIGDSAEDMKLASAVRATAYLYAHPGREWPDLEADYMINDLREVRREI